jgi:hypothetical protein
MPPPIRFAPSWAADFFKRPMHNKQTVRRVFVPLDKATMRLANRLARLWKTTADDAVETVLRAHLAKEGWL